MKKKNEFDVILLYCNRTKPKLVTETKRLEASIKEKTSVEVRLILTSGSRELEEELAKCGSFKHPLIVSVGGDGSFNLLVNVLPKTKLNPVVAVYPAGTANDHARVAGYSKERLLEGIISGETQEIDLIEIKIAGKTEDIYYAHSYFAIGVTGLTAKAINDHHMSLFFQVLIAIKEILFFKPVVITGKKMTHIGWHSISEMCRFIKISKEGRVDDGLLEIYKISATPFNRIKILLVLAKGWVFGLNAKEQVEESIVLIPEDTWSQLDGEELLIPAKSQVTVKARAGELTVLAY